MTIGKHLTPQVEEVNDLRERGMLSTQINHQHNGQNVLLRRKIKIAQHIGGTKPTKWWDINYDKHLLIGAATYGVSNWDNIRQDKSLGFMKKKK
eukprot:155526_1